MLKLKKLMNTDKKSNLKILLVLPRYSFSNTENYVYSYPLGLMYISSVLKKANYDVTCINLNHLNGTTQNLMKKELDRQKYDIVATGHMGIGYPMVESIINSAKEHHSKPKTILGGVIITSEPSVIFESLKPTFGVLGEGEVTILELLECIEYKKDPNKVNGIIFRDKNNKTIITPAQTPIKNLDELPFPDFGGFQMEKRFEHLYSAFDYSDTIHDYPRNYLILASRGCPFNCSFCYHSLGGQYRERSIKNVIEELKWAIDKYKINSFFLNDDLFSYKQERIEEFCKEIKKLSEYAGYKLVWSCQLSVSHVDRPLLRTLKDAGCNVVGYGFESYSKEILRSMKKPITPEKINKTIKLMMEEKMGIIGGFIFGDIAETKETAKETLDYWKENCKEQVLLAFIQPFPGSEIYNHCLRTGIIKNKLDFVKNQLPKQITFRTAINMTQMNDKDFAKLKKTIEYLNNNPTYKATPLSIKKEEKGKNYEVLTKCPFCKEKTLYKNFYLPKRYLYRPYIFCRKCNRGYHLLSPVVLTLKKLGILWFAEEFYYSTKRAIFKLKNKGKK
jgi:anaerobic magnesium-protoporphyrin IX monomethyl ester cyclase